MDKNWTHRTETRPPTTGWHRRWPGRPAKTLLHATATQKGSASLQPLRASNRPFSNLARSKTVSIKMPSVRPRLLKKQEKHEPAPISTNSTIVGSCPGANVIAKKGKSTKRGVDRVISLLVPTLLLIHVGHYLALLPLANFR